MPVLIFLLGFIIFLTAALYFSTHKKPNDFTKISSLVFFTTTVSYCVLISGIWLINTSPDSILNQTIYPTRWLFYILSCGLLMYEVAKILNKSTVQKIQMLVLNSLVMLTGFLASIVESPFKWLFFIISSLIFLVLLKIIYEKDGKQTQFMESTRCFIVWTWSLFPIVWLLAPTGIGIFTAFTAAFLYLLLDITTKILFSYFTAKGQYSLK